jgi:large subunit ribosomal protein L17
MRHNRKINHLSRTNTHREAMLSNMASSLIKEKRIFTTLAKARALRKYIEPLITKSRLDTTHSRRTVFKNLKDKYAVKELFLSVAQKIGDRPGGYTRIIKTGNRLGDNAAMCLIELVDYNELLLKEKAPAKASKTRRSRKKGGSSDDAVRTTTAIPAAAVEIETSEEVVDAEVVETTDDVAVEAETTPDEATAVSAETETPPVEAETPQAEAQEVASENPKTE